MAKCVLLSSWHIMFFNQFPECQRDNNQVPSVTDFVAQIKKDKIVVRYMSSVLAKLSCFSKILLALAFFSNICVFLQQDCSVATCSVFKCNRFMGRTETLKYDFSAIMTSGWIEQVKSVYMSGESSEWSRPSLTWRLSQLNLFLASSSYFIFSPFIHLILPSTWHCGSRIHTESHLLYITSPQHRWPSRAKLSFRSI